MLAVGLLIGVGPALGSEVVLAMGKEGWQRCGRDEGRGALASCGGAQDAGPRAAAGWAAGAGSAVALWRGRAESDAGHARPRLHVVP